jgi:hypothetical protein
LGQVSGSQISLLDVEADGVVDFLKLKGEARVLWRSLGAELSDAGAIKAGMDASKEQGGAHAEWGDLITVGLGMLSIMPCKRRRRGS